MPTTSPDPDPNNLRPAPPSPPSKSTFLKNLFSHSPRSILSRAHSNSLNAQPSTSPPPPQSGDPQSGQVLQQPSSSSDGDGEEGPTTTIVCRQKNIDRTILEVVRLAASPSSSPTVSPVASPISLFSPLNEDLSEEREPRALFFQIVHQTDSHPSYHFSPLPLSLAPDESIKLGRKACFAPNPSTSQSNYMCLNFYSQVVSRSHAEITCYETDNGNMVLKLKDLGSASGTFLNGRRLSISGVKSKEYLLHEGDLIKLGISYHDGAEEKYKCVQMRIQISPKTSCSMQFSHQALREFQQLSPPTSPRTLHGSPLYEDLAEEEIPGSCSECCICLESLISSFPILLLSCGHTIHFDCISHLIEINYPDFSCPVCRGFVNLGINIEDEMQSKDAGEKCTLCKSSLSVQQSLILLSCHHVSHFQCVHDWAKKLGKNLTDLNDFACCENV